MKLAEILPRLKRKVVTIGPSEPVSAAISSFVNEGIRGLVVTEEERVVGMVTVRDLLRQLDRNGAAALTEPVSSAMTRDVLTASPEDLLDALNTRFVENRIDHLPVVRDGKLVGLVTPADVLARHLQHILSINDHLTSYMFGPGHKAER